MLAPRAAVPGLSFKEHLIEEKTLISRTCTKGARSQSFLLTRAIRVRFSAQCEINHLLAKLAIAQSSSSGGFGQQTGFRHARERVYFQDKRFVVVAHHHVHSPIIPRADRAKCAQGRSLNSRRELRDY